MPNLRNLRLQHRMRHPSVGSSRMLTRALVSSSKHPNRGFETNINFMQIQLWVYIVKMFVFTHKQVTESDIKSFTNIIFHLLKYSKHGVLGFWGDRKSVV